MESNIRGPIAAGRATGSPQRERARESGTEGLRGLAALMVLYTHLLVHDTQVDPIYKPSGQFWILEVSQGAVLLFFVLSGYVIGMTNLSPLNPRTARDYAWRRMLRIVPLYLAAVLLGYASRPVDGGRVLLGNLLFLQNDQPYGSWSMPVISGNTNLWSLNYEVLFYLVFPAVWACPKLWPAWLLGSIVASVAFWGWHGGGPVTAGYFAGWTFWLAGYALARAPKVSVSAAERIPWPSILLAWIAAWHLKPLWNLAHRTGALPHLGTWLNYTYDDFVVQCIALLMVASGRRPPGYRWFAGLAVAEPAAYCVWMAIRGRVFASGPSWDVIFSGAAVALYWWRPSPQVFFHLAPIGAVSYALYIFQRPVQWFVRDAAWLPSGSALSFTLRLVFILAITGTIAWIAERKFQPWLRRRCFPAGRKAGGRESQISLQPRFDRD